MNITKKVASVVGFIALVLPLSQVTAQAEVDAAGELAVAGIDAAELRPGWQLVGDEIVWDDGAVMASISPAGADDCNSGYLCFWEHDNFTGRRLQFQAAGLRADMRDYSFNDTMSSWRNRNSRDARWYHDIGGSGGSRCMNNGTRNSDVGPPLVPGTDDNGMSSFRIYSNSTSC